MKSKKTDRKWWFLFAEVILMCGSFFTYFENAVVGMNVTVFALSYRYGFVARGLPGTVLDIITNGKPTYNDVFVVSSVALAVLFLTLLIFSYVVINRTSDENNVFVKIALLIMVVITAPMFLTVSNFGRLDIYLIIIMLLCLMAMYCEKLEWTIPVLCCIAMLIHEGFVFMNINIILVGLIYLESENFSCRHLMS